MTTRLVRTRVGGEYWDDIKKIREVVFIQEQDCPFEEEFDGLDEEATQFIGLVDEVPVFCARYRTWEDKDYKCVKLERFAVLKENRRKGYGRTFIERVIEEAKRDNYEKLFLHAQVYISKMYESLGFQKVGEEFQEVGIPHISMYMIV